MLENMNMKLIYQTKSKISKISVSLLEATLTALQDTTMMDQEIKGVKLILMVIITITMV